MVLNLDLNCSFVVILNFFKLQQLWDGSKTTMMRLWRPWKSWQCSCTHIWGFFFFFKM